jgi:putative autoinducer-2 (AI-2) aldolase
MGRNIWQSDNPVPMIRAVRSIVHGNSNVNDAFTLYEKLCKENPVKNSLKKQKIKNTQPKKQNNFQPKKQNNFQPKKQNNFQPKK